METIYKVDKRNAALVDVPDGQKQLVIETSTSQPQVESDKTELSNSPSPKKSGKPKRKKHGFGISS